MKNLIFKLRKNIYHRLTASTKYQLHSPFLYKLATEIFFGKNNDELTKEFQLLKVKSSKLGIISLKKAQVLSRLLVLIEPKTILYVGSSEVNLKVLTLASRNSKVNSIKDRPYFVDTDIDGMDSLDFVFCDRGDANKMRGEFDNYLKYRTNNSIFVFNDIYRSSAMNDTWNYIKNHPETIVSIDLFHMGIILFRKEMSRQQIKYRY